jgi:deoxyxylulose-5-phosphate synthase
MGLKLDGKKSRVFCLLGDGEIQEGQVWEAALSAPKFKLNNLVAILDNNNGQIDGYVEDVMSLAPIADKWRAFNWNVIQINGHDMSQILGALASAKKEKEKPVEWKLEDDNKQNWYYENEEEYQAWMRKERARGNNNFVAIKGPAPFGATFSDGTLIPSNRQINIGWHCMSHRARSEGSISSFYFVIKMRDSGETL